jgi:2,4-dienoyl-CoA reductase-like NADH-dependent reductase (Old Yellow Enzyme family)/NADPH-dependent 2,4-dienoyl-CoA reductase/sulfur reductase-like enzyme
LKQNFEKLYSPFQVKNLVLRNRLVYPPIGTGYTTNLGVVTPRVIAYHQARAAGGVGLNILEFTVVEEYGNLHSNMPGIYDDSHIPGLKRLTEAIHQANGKICVQLGHAGRRAKSTYNGGRRPRAPSSIPELGGDHPYEMNQSQIDYMQECFYKAAKRARQAGFDAVEMHAAHGYLIHQFLSPLSNRRTDAYGGSLENRARFALETLSRIREGVGDEFPVFCRVSGDDFLDGGSSLAETKQFVKLLEKAGVDLIDVSAGVPESSERVVPPMAVDRGCNVAMTAEIKRQVSLPVICVGRIKSLEEAEAILQGGSADLIALGRALIADPDLPQKTCAGERVRPCIGCNQCIDRLYRNMGVACMVNAQLGRETQDRVLPKVQSAKNIAVIGGGPAGLEFARIASARGHRVTVYEKDAALGGKFRIGAIPPHKSEIDDYVDYLIQSIRASGVTIRTGVAIDAEKLDSLLPFDEIVIAVGGVSIRPALANEQPNVVLAEEVLERKVSLGSKVAVLGGGLVGCETAEWIAAQGKQVTLIEQLPDIARDMELRTRKLLLQRMADYRIEIVCHTRVESLNGDKAICSQGGVRFEIDGIDTFVLALGYKPDQFIVQLENKTIHRIGDCVQPRKAIEAIHAGYQLGLEI